MTRDGLHNHAAAPLQHHRPPHIATQNEAEPYQAHGHTPTHAQYAHMNSSTPTHNPYQVGYNPQYTPTGYGPHYANATPQPVALPSPSSASGAHHGPYPHHHQSAHTTPRSHQHSLPHTPSSHSQHSHTSPHVVSPHHAHHAHQHVHHQMSHSPHNLPHAPHPHALTPTHSPHNMNHAVHSPHHTHTPTHASQQHMAQYGGNHGGIPSHSQGPPTPVHMHSPYGMEASQAQYSQDGGAPPQQHYDGQAAPQLTPNQQKAANFANRAAAFAAAAAAGPTGYSAEYTAYPMAYDPTTHAQQVPPSPSGFAASVQAGVAANTPHGLARSPGERGGMGGASQRRQGDRNNANSNGNGNGNRNGGTGTGGGRGAGRGRGCDPAKWKTSMCNHYKQHGNCPFGDRCAFAHGEQELRKRLAAAAAAAAAANSAAVAPLPAFAATPSA